MRPQHMYVHTHIGPIPGTSTHMVRGSVMRSDSSSESIFEVMYRFVQEGDHICEHQHMHIGHDHTPTGSGPSRVEGRDRDQASPISLRICMSSLDAALSGDKEASKVLQ